MDQYLNFSKSYFIFYVSYIIYAFAFILTISAASPANTLLVPSQYPTIQAGINAALDGDTVLVADGTYTGTGNKNLDFFGKAIAVKSANGAENCIIDCQNQGRGFYFHNGEGFDSIVSGFTILHGAGEGAGIFCFVGSPTIENCIIRESVHYSNAIACLFGSDAVINNCSFIENTGYGTGGAVFINESEVTISNCLFENNQGGDGGAVYICEARPFIFNCVFNNNSAQMGGAIAYDIGGVDIYHCQFYGNSATYWGGAIYIKYGESTIDHCVFSGNFAGQHGGAIAVNMAETALTNCTVDANACLGNGGGLFVHWSGEIPVENCIVSNNLGNGGLYGDSEYSYSTIAYGDFFNNQGGNFVGTGFPAEISLLALVNFNNDSCDIYYNIFQPPLFVDPISGNYNLQAVSPCIDAGDPNLQLDPDSTIADLGAYYFDQNVTVIEDLFISVQENDITLLWSPFASALSYNIYRSDTPYFNIYTMTPITIAAENSYIDLNIIGQGSYYYIVTTNY